MAWPPAERWQWLSLLGGKTKMADIVSSPLSGGNGVADDGGRDSVISRQPGVPPDEGLLDDNPGRQKY